MRKSFALFDFDGTMIPGDSIFRFCLYAHRQGHMSRKQLWCGAWATIRYCLQLFTAEQCKMAALSFLAGMSHTELATLSLHFYQNELQPLLRPQALAALEKHRREGLTVLLITASPSFYLEPLKAEYGIEAVIATRMDVDATGVATGLICGENCKGIQKPLRLAEYLAATGERLDYETSYAYGNSGSDFPMLALCGHKVAVNGSRRLKKKLRNETGVEWVCWND